MLRRSFITVILIIAIVLGSLPVDAEATESSIYQSSAMQEMLDAYLYNEDYLNILTIDSGIGYWKDVNELHKKQRASNLFDWGSGMLNEKYTKEDYAELLTYLMAANEVCLTEMIENTASFDKDYNLRDFSMDMLGIATDVLSTTNNLGLTEEGSALDRIVGTAVDTIGDAAKLKEDFAENKKYYYTILQEYTSNIMFLSAIYKNTTIDDLKEVSEKMMQIEMKGLMTKIEYLGDNLESFVEFEGQIYVKNLALPTLQIIAKENGYELAEIVAGGFGKLVDTVFSEGALTFDLIMTFVGDLTFATTDTYRRQNELIALAEAARCVSIECDQITIDNSPGKTTLEKIEKKLYYYSLLLRIHARGEYSLYKMISNKMNILVCFEEDVTDLKNFVKSIFQGTPFVKERPYEDWIKSQLSSLTEMESVVNSLRDSIQYISSRSYVTGKVLCKDTGKGAFNAFLELESEENYTFLMAKEGGNVKGYVTPGSYRCTVILDGYEDYVTDIVIKEEGTNIGTIVLKREGEPEEAGNEAVDNDEIIEQYKAFIQSKNTGSDYQNYIIYDIDKDGYPELLILATIPEERRSVYEIYSYESGGFEYKTQCKNCLPHGPAAYASYPNGNGMIAHYSFRGAEGVILLSLNGYEMQEEQLYLERIEEHPTQYYLDEYDQVYADSYGHNKYLNHQFYVGTTASPYCDDSYLLGQSAMDNFTAVYEAFGVKESDETSAGNSSNPFMGISVLNEGTESNVSTDGNLFRIRYDSADAGGRYVGLNLYVNDIAEAYNLDAILSPYIEKVYVTDIDINDSYYNIVVVIGGEDEDCATYLFAFNDSEINMIQAFNGRLIPESANGDGTVLLQYVLGMVIHNYGIFCVRPEISVNNLSAEQVNQFCGRRIDSGTGSTYEDGFLVPLSSDLTVYAEPECVSAAGIIPAGSSIECEYIKNLDVGNLFYVTGDSAGGYVNSGMLKASCKDMYFAG